MNNQIKCPYCNKSFEPTDAYKHELEEKLLRETQEKHQEEIEKLKREKQELTVTKDRELEDTKKQVAEAVRLEVGKKIKQEMEATIEISKKEAEVKAKQNTELQEQLEEKSKLLGEMKEEKNKLRLAHEQELEETKKQIVEKAKIEAQKSVTKELKDREDQIAQLKKRAEAAEEEELKVRKEKRELEESKRKFELEKQRQLDEERNKIRDQALKEAQENHELKDKEKDKMIDDLKKSLADAQRKAQQGSQQTQGEVLELEIEDILTKEFPTDSIEEVKKGQRGADVLQRVIDKKGKVCGTILWESKNAQWSNQWIGKLKEDQRAAKAHLAVLVVTDPPEKLEAFAFRDGVWIVVRKMIVPLALALRFDLIRLNYEKLSNVGKNEKMEVLYQYITSMEFAHRVEAIIEAFGRLQEEMERERRWFQSKWARQEKQLRKVMDHTHGMYGDLQGVVGKSLPDIKILQLESGKDE